MATVQNYMMHQLSTAGEGLGEARDDDTRLSYGRNLGRFSEWAVSEYGSHGKALKAIKKDPPGAIQRYSDYLQNVVRDNGKHYSAATIHTYLAPVCLSLRVNMREIDKPKRSAASITRGRNGGSARALADASNPKYDRLRIFQQATGIRRTELAKLRPEDVFYLHDGLYVHVLQGKGGKEQLQLVSDPEAVMKVLETVPDGQKTIFSKDEMKNHMNLHGMRQEEARAAYFRYAEQCKTPEGRKALQDALILRYDRFHPRPDKMRKASLKKSDTQRSRFLRSIEDRPIRLRSSKEIAIRDGMPVIYDRTSVMAVSVFCLSHWRSDVTITNYLI